MSRIILLLTILFTASCGTPTKDRYQEEKVLGTEPRHRDARYLLRVETDEVICFSYYGEGTWCHWKEQKE